MYLYKELSLNEYAIIESIFLKAHKNTLNKAQKVTFSMRFQRAPAVTTFLMKLSLQRLNFSKQNCNFF